MDESTGTFYAKTKLNYRGNRQFCVNMNAVIMGTVGTGRIADHIDRNTLNNRRANLRILNASRSACNRRRFSNSSSGYTGVCRPSGQTRYLSYINFGGKRKIIGRFEDPVIAAKERDREAIRLHGDCAVLNFPGEA